MSDLELDQIIHFWWPRVMRHAMAGHDAWLQGFVRSIASHAKRASWRPSPKQASLMRRLVAELTHSPADQLLIED